MKSNFVTFVNYREKYNLNERIRLWKFILGLFFCMFTFGVTAQPVLQYTKKNKKIKLAVAEANRILRDSTFYSQIDTIKSFECSILTGQQIVNEIRNCNDTIEIFNRWYLFDSYYAFVKPWAPKSIYINRTQTLKHGIFEYVSTLIHETIHVVDFRTNGKQDYGHACDYKSFLNCAPYLIGHIAKIKLIKQKDKN